MTAMTCDATQLQPDWKTKTKNGKTSKASTEMTISPEITAAHLGFLNNSTLCPFHESI